MHFCQCDILESLLNMDINHAYLLYFVGTNAVNQLAKYLVLLYYISYHFLPNQLAFQATKSAPLHKNILDINNCKFSIV